MSEPMAQFAAHLERHGIIPRGIIHLGAHEGSELATYQRMGFRKIVYVEANPELHRRLEARTRDLPGVTVLHAAVTDRDGDVRLNLTSMDQSSSILPLGLHAEVYPNIKVTGQVTVRGRRLDTLLAEHGLRAEDYNVLNIDIQGAELLALKGAEETLKGIELLNTEVNLAELYQGCALLPELERHLSARGLRRAALTTPFHPTWGDAIYVRRPVVTMRTLGENGRFANQLFQYLALQRLAARTGAIIQVPPWAGQTWFGLEDPAPVLDFPQLREEALGGPEPLLEAAAAAGPEIDLHGFAQPHTSALRPHRDLLRRLFRPVPPYDALVDRLHAVVRAGGRTLVGVHVRRGDFGTGRFFRAPFAWYEAWLDRLWPALDAPVLYVASDDLRRALRAFRRFKPMSVKAAGRSARPHDVLLDLALLARADALAISNSSYSFMASLLNERATRFVRPTLSGAGLEPYDPWDSPVLLGTELGPGEQSRLDALDPPGLRGPPRRDPGQPRPALSRVAKALQDKVLRPIRRRFSP